MIIASVVAIVSMLHRATRERRARRGAERLPVAGRAYDVRWPHTRAPGAARCDQNWADEVAGPRGRIG